MVDYIELTGWTEERAIEARMRNFWHDLHQNNRLEYSLKLAGLPATCAKKVLYAIQDFFDDSNVDYCCQDCLKERLMNLLFDSNRGEEKPAKYLAKQLHQQYDVKLPNELRAELGNSLVEDKIQELKILISLGCEGNAEDYYHERSCYWGEFEGSRDYIEFNGGGAVRAYNMNNDLVGRVWFVPYNGEYMLKGMLLFNAYGEAEFQHVDKWGTIVAEALKADVQPTSASITPGGYGRFYLNTPTSNFVGQVIKQARSRYKINLTLPEPDEYRYGSSPRRTCDLCGGHCHRADTSLVEDKILCSSCVRKHFTYLRTDFHYGLTQNESVVNVKFLRRDGSSYIAQHHKDDPCIVYVNEEAWNRRDCTQDDNGEWTIEEPKKSGPTLSVPIDSNTLFRAFLEDLDIGE